MINILTIQSPTGGTSHIIPLFVLHMRYIIRTSGLTNYFLTPSQYHQQFKNCGINILDIDNSENKNLKKIIERKKISNREAESMNTFHLNKILEGVKSVRPNIIIEDFEPYTSFICKKEGIARISIQRTGFFRSIPMQMRNPNHMHSIEKGSHNIKLYDASIILNNKSVQLKTKNDSSLCFLNSLSSYLDSEAKIIPGIASLETLPTSIKNKESYFYSGPLNVEDNPSPKLKKELSDFLKLNSDKTKVFITTGLVDTTPIDDFVYYLIEKNYTVISTSKTELDIESKSSFFFNRFLPLNYICSKVDLVIHQCGSGMYHYPIINEKPTITIGTQCYDREDIAQKLQLMGVSKHVPNKKDNNCYFQIFEEAIKCFEDNMICDFNKLKELKQEIFETILNFDIQLVIDYALDKSKKREKI